MVEQQQDVQGLMSPGGFIIGVQGWVWGEPKPKTITFFLDNTAGVYDQYGRPIRGTLVDNKRVLFAMSPPGSNDKLGERKELATHAQVIAALTVERVDWKTLTWGGWPQLPYDQLVPMIKSNTLPPTPVEELRKIKDPDLRKDALRARREADDLMIKEMQAAAEE